MALKRLNEELGFPGQQALLLAAKRKGLAATRQEVRELVEGNAAKQTLAPLQRSEGKTVAESEHARWQMDLAELNDNTGSERYALCVMNIFDRKLFTEPLPNKRPATVRDALKKILARAGGKPITISSDKGLEFTSRVVADYLEGEDIAQRFKEPGDPNALGVVDRAIGLLKKKLATIAGTHGDSWGDALGKATAALNATPKPEVLHGAAPDDVKGEPEVKFMLLQDNARKLQHNEALATKRRAALQRAGGHFRAPLVGDVHPRFRRGFRAHYGPIRTAMSVEGSTVSDESGAVHDLKLLQPAPGEVREPREAFRRPKRGQ